jgi:hypothetical protein
MKKLPVGIQPLSELIGKDHLYADNLETATANRNILKHLYPYDMDPVGGQKRTSISLN